MIRIFIVDDHPVTITGLHSYFRPSRSSIIITESASTMDEAMSVADPRAFDVIFMDLWLPEGDPLENFKKLQKKFPDKPVILYTGEDSIHWQRKMFKAGAKAYISKQASKSEIRQTLERVMKGDTVYTANVNDFQSKRKIYSYHDPKYGLTEEQKEILEYFIEGNSAKTIAGKMKKNVTSIDRLIRKVREIFNAANNLELLKTLLKLDDEGIIEDLIGN
jgi:DNA-binding NarL/FixJ family response regulator